MDFIYHLTIPQAWAKALASGDYRAGSFVEEGFLHASTSEQVEASANRYFGGSQSIVALKIELGKIKAPLVWEESKHSATPFPHVYGPINLDAVVEVIPWERSAGGGFVWPPHPRRSSSTDDRPWAFDEASRSVPRLRHN